MRSWPSARFRQRHEPLPPGVTRSTLPVEVVDLTTGRTTKGTETIYTVHLNRTSPEDLSALQLKVTRETMAPLVYDWLTTDAKDAARQIGIPELAYLHKLRPPEQSIPLEEVGKMYLDRKSKPLHPRWRRDCKAYWDEFCKLTGCKTVADLDGDAMALYRDAIYKARLEKDATPRYVNNRFDAIGVVLGFVPTAAGDRDSESVARALTLLKMLQRLDSDEENPHPIAPKAFKKLLVVADKKWTAILLLSLNCGFYPIDAVQVERSHIDLKAKTLANFRTKTRRGKRKSRRIAVLWDRTIKAIQDYWAEQPHGAETVFVSDLGTPYAEKTFQNYFRGKIRKAARLEEGQASFNMIRDGAASAAGNGDGVDPLHVDMLLGHRVTTRDRYWFKKPQLVAKACGAIEAHYVPPKRSQRKPIHPSPIQS